MRTLVLLTVLFFAVAIKAQTLIPINSADFTQGNRIAHNIYLADSLPKSKWSLSRYNSISTSFTFFKGGNASIISAPMGLQLNRMLNNNLYAFANIAVVPAYINFNHAFISTCNNKMNTGSVFRGPNHLGLYSAASMGLMYINNNKTFSISGSVSVENSNIPPLLVYPVNTTVQMPYGRTNR
ncbi:MAG: hypothetical protein JWP81_1308 [Ferruginibacter sp.]|nr:hypothetical protein [Ferruginibacter sp.]